MKRLEEFISRPKEVEYHEVLRYKSVISQKDALLDLDEFSYIMDNAYSGKDFWQRQDISFEECYNKIKAFIHMQQELYIGDLCRAIHKAFDVGIVDNHLSFLSPSTGRLVFSKKYEAYFSNILVEKQEGKYMVIKSDSKDIPIGACVEGKDCFFPTLSAKHREFYLIGIRSWNECKTMNIIVNHHHIEVPLHRCRAVTKMEDVDLCLNQSKILGLEVVRSNCCEFLGGIDAESDIEEIGKQYRDTKRLVWNNLSNIGGYSRIPKHFIKGLNGYTHCEEYCAKLISPVIQNKPCKREWLLSEAVDYDYSKSEYNGTLYFLMNSDTASSGESSVLFAKSLKNVVFIGENTMGCNTFGNVSSYLLPHSNIVLRVPNMINQCKNPDDCIEGKGFTPDFWVDSEDVQSEVIAWINEPDSYFPFVGGEKFGC
jgi:hypothetical protein